MSSNYVSNLYWYIIVWQIIFGTFFVGHPIFSTGIRPFQPEFGHFQPEFGQTELVPGSAEFRLHLKIWTTTTTLNKNNIYFEDTFNYLILYERENIGDSKTIKFTQIEEVFTEL